MICKHLFVAYEEKKTSTEHTKYLSFLFSSLFLGFEEKNLFLVITHDNLDGADIIEGWRLELWGAAWADCRHRGWAQVRSQRVRIVESMTNRNDILGAVWARQRRFSVSYRSMLRLLVLFLYLWSSKLPFFFVLILSQIFFGNVSGLSFVYSQRSFLYLCVQKYEVPLKENMRWRESERYVRKLCVLLLRNRWLFSSIHSALRKYP